MAITLVHQTHAVTAFGGSTTKAITIPAPTAGNTLIIQQCNLISSSFITSVKQGTTSCSLQASQYTSGNSYLETYVLANCGTGTTINIVVTSTYSVADVVISEWSGMPTTLALDQTGANTGTASTITTSTITPTSTGPVLIVAHAESISQSITGTPGNGFTEFTDASGTVNRGAFAYKILSAGAAVSTSWPKSASYGTASMLIAGFDGTSGGGFIPAPYYYIKRAA